MPCSGEEVPLCNRKEAFAKEFKDNDAGRFEEFVRDKHTTMFAILTRPSKLVVIDCEAIRKNHEDIGMQNFRKILKKAGIRELPETFTVKTPCGGPQFYFWADRNDYKTCTGELAPFVNIRAGGSGKNLEDRIIAPYSYFGNKKYTPVNPEAPILPLPDALKKILPKVPVKIAPEAFAGFIPGICFNHSGQTCCRPAQNSGCSKENLRINFNPERYLKPILDNLKHAVSDSHLNTLSLQAFKAYRLLNYFQVSNLTSRLTSIAIARGLDACDIRETLKSALPGLPASHKSWDKNRKKPAPRPVKKAGSSTSCTMVR